MKKQKLIAAALSLALLLTGCGGTTTKRPENRGQQTETEASQPVTAPTTEVLEKGFPSSEAAYNAYLQAVLALDVDAFCALFSEEEIASSRAVTQKFMKNNFGLMDDAVYQSYLARTQEDAFRKSVEANFNSFESAMISFGTSGEKWEILPGTAVDFDKDQVNSFAVSLSLDITAGKSYTMYFLHGTESDTALNGETVMTLKIGDKWYPSYTKQCAPETLQYELPTETGRVLR